MRERERQNKVNQEIQLEEQEAESKAKVMGGFLSKQNKINQVTNDKA